MMPGSESPEPYFACQWPRCNCMDEPGMPPLCPEEERRAAGLRRIASGMKYMRPCSTPMECLDPRACAEQSKCCTPGVPNVGELRALSDTAKREGWSYVAIPASDLANLLAHCSGAAPSGEAQRHKRHPDDYGGCQP